MQSKTAVPQKRKKQSPFVVFLRRFSRRKEAVVAVGILVFLAILSVISPLICKYSYSEMNMNGAFMRPCKEYLLGTDSLGRDMLSRILYGGRFSLSVGIISVAISAFGGLIFGSFAGFFGGKADMLIMRFMDIFHAIPNILLAVCISAVFGPGFFKTVLALGIAGVPNFARVIRANILSVRNNEYVEAAVATNCSSFTIIFGHVVPNAMTPFLVQCTIAMANGLIAAATLSYIGLGIQPPLPEWGAMLSDARPYLEQYPYLMLVPGVAIMIVVMSFNIIGDAVRDALDPKLKK